MDESVIRRLNIINENFYTITALEFDRTRERPWPGWSILLKHVITQPGGQSFKVLDVGCGNGRFGMFLADNLGREIDYHGIDNNQTLLDIAFQNLAQAPGVATTVERRDIVEDPPTTGLFDLVALFGVLHHIPGADRRRRVLQMLAERVKPGGVLAFACWRFYEFERFRERIIPWPADLADEVETYDYLLDWRRGEVALRYCHYVTDDEHESLVKATGLVEIDTFRADGMTGTVNRYSALRRVE